MSPARGTGLVLGAGGAFAWVYHLGVLDGLSATLDPAAVEGIVGTSAGAVIGAALLAGTTTDAFLAALAAAAPEGLLRALLDARARADEEAYRPQWGWRASHPRLDLARLSRFAPRGLFQPSFEELPIGAQRAWDARLWAPAVRVSDGETVVMGRDVVPQRIADGVGASAAVPLVFSPQMIDGQAYIDGAISSPTHAGLMLERDCERVLVSCPMARAGRSALRLLARRRVAEEVDRLRGAGREVLLLSPTAAVVEAAAGYPLRDREARLRLFAAASEQARQSAGKAAWR